MILVSYDMGVSKKTNFGNLHYNSIRQVTSLLIKALFVIHVYFCNYLFFRNGNVRG